MKKIIVAALGLLLLAEVVSAQEKAPVSPEVVIPKPVKVVPAQGSFNALGKVPRVICPDKALAKELRAAGVDASLVREAYRIRITSRGITIRAVTDAGVFYARQTLEQMSHHGNVYAACTVTDWPRFAYRGVMKSMSGIFNPKEYVFRMIDLFSSLKYNVFHLHFADDRGWRLESESWPELNAISCWRKSAAYEDRYNFVREGTPGAYGGYWSKADAREIVEYAALHNMEVIPEVEMPGHCRAVLASYPELRCEDVRTGEKILSSDLCPGNELTYRFLTDVLDEVMEIFPGEYIHIGGDEAFKTSWERCRLCRQKMQEEGLENLEQLQSYLMKRISRYVESKGRKVMGWSEIAQGGIPDNVTVMQWKGGADVTGSLLSSGHDVVLEPENYTYFCFPQNGPYDWKGMPAGWVGNNISLEDAYLWEPMDGIGRETAGKVLGVEASLWGVYKVTGTDLDAPFGFYFPRAFATAEVGWSGPEKDYADFRERVLPLAQWYRDHGTPCFDIRNEAGPRPESLRPVNHLAKGCRTIPSCDILTDGEFGGWGVWSSRWKSFDEVDIVIDLGEVKHVGVVCPSVFDKSTVQPHYWVELSSDGITYTHAGDVWFEQQEAGRTPSYRLLPIFVDADARYVRLRSHSTGANKYGSRHIYIDEIVVK